MYLFISAGLDKKSRASAIEKLGTLSSLDKSILESCKSGLNIVRVLKVGKPYVNSYGRKQFATTSEILSAVERLVKGGLLERR